MKFSSSRIDFFKPTQAHVYVNKLNSLSLDSLKPVNVGIYRKSIFIGDGHHRCALLYFISKAYRLEFEVPVKVYPRTYNSLLPIFNSSSLNDLGEMLILSSSSKLIFPLRDVIFRDSTVLFRDIGKTQIICDLPPKEEVIKYFNIE